jgi:polysaccharide biosynthesis/export protein
MLSLNPAMAELVALRPFMQFKKVGFLLVFGLFAAFAFSTSRADTEYLLGTGDVIRVNVFKNPDLSIDARVSESGSIAYPLIGGVPVRGLTLAAAEKKIAEMLKEGGFVLSPQINILVTQGFNNLVSVLGGVRNPGRYSLDAAGGHLSGMLAAAGGVGDTGGDLVVVSGVRGGKPFRREIDIVKMASSSPGDDVDLAGGDTLFVNRAPMFYIYGQVQRPGQVRLERNMTVMQALASGGGFTGKGTGRGLVRHRRDPATGKVKEEGVNLDDEVRDEDVIYVKESLF